jgi:hypothetical protein
MRSLLLLASMVAVGCAHTPLSPAALEAVERPAFIARIEQGAGPKSVVFRDDAGSYKERLKKLDAKEADRRLALKLEKGTDKERAMNRYQVADTLRAQLLSELPKARPWTRAASPTQVATALESFLVDEVPANAPDVSRLAPLGVDAVVEIVIEDFGLRSEKGKAGVYLVGTAEFYRPGGALLYRRAFFSDELRAGLTGLDPFEVARHPAIFSDRLKPMLEAIAHQIAADLSVGAVRAEPEPVGTKRQEQTAPTQQNDVDPL